MGLRVGAGAAEATNERPRLSERRAAPPRIPISHLERQRLPAPLLYISEYLEDYRRDYYDSFKACGSAASLRNGFSSF